MGVAFIASIGAFGARITAAALTCRASHVSSSHQITIAIVLSSLIIPSAKCMQQVALALWNMFIIACADARVRVAGRIANKHNHIAALSS